ncbi:TPA: hypothetical protein ACX3LH_000993 [Klebsiella michiganensis]
MKLIAVKPIYFSGVVVAEGELLETQEQHGRELVKKGYVRLVDVDNSAQQEQQEQQEQPETVPEKKAKK